MTLKHTVKFKTLRTVCAAMGIVGPGQEIGRDGFVCPPDELQSPFETNIENKGSPVRNKVNPESQDCMCLRVMQVRL